MAKNDTLFSKKNFFCFINFCINGRLFTFQLLVNQHFHTYVESQDEVQAILHKDDGAS